MQTLGYDLGSSSIKASIIDTDRENVLLLLFIQKRRCLFRHLQQGWAEQDPEMWWKYALMATRELLRNPAVDPDAIAAIGISYQMHGLVIVDKDHKPLAPFCYLV
jgi:xylulokinase